MEVTMQPVHLTALVTQLNRELQEHVISCLALADADCVIGWNRAGEDARLDVSNGDMVAEVHSVVLPATSFSLKNPSLSCNGARVEIILDTRAGSFHARTAGRGGRSKGTLVYTLASLEPQHIEETAIAIADTISKHLDSQLEPC